MRPWDCGGVRADMPEFSHYFTDNGTMESDERTLSIQYSDTEFTFVTDSGVFSKTRLDDGSRILLDALSGMDVSGRVLDLGCGWGAIGIILMKAIMRAPMPITDSTTIPITDTSSVAFADVNPRAAALTRRNLQINGLGRSAEVYVSDGVADVPGMFDWIITNPPIRAGKSVVCGMIRAAADRLNQGGRLALVVRRQQGAESMLRFLQEIFPRVDVPAKHKGYWVLIATNI